MSFEVKSTGGDTHLGGDDIDQIIINWIVSEFKKDSGIDVSKDMLALQRLKDAAEKSQARTFQHLGNGNQYSLCNF